jgi:hypothetical protein
MNRSIYLVFILIALGLMNSMCHGKDDECMCKDNEDCIYSYTGKNECYLNEWVHYLGGIRVIARNSYVGINNNSSCIDTLIFYNDTTRAIDDDRFGLIVDVPPGTQNVLGSNPPFQASSNEFYTSSVEPMCYSGGEGWYSNIHFIIYPDSVWMKLKFWKLESDPGVFVDSTIITFYKEH